MADPAVGPRRLGPLEQSVFKDDVLPAIAAEAVQEVTIDAADLELFQLFVQEAVEVRRGLNHPDGRFRRQLDTLAVAILQRFAEDALAVPAVVRVGGIDVVHAPVDRMPDHADRFVLADIRAHGTAAQRRQAHAAETQGRNLPSRLAESSEMHLHPPRL